MGAARRLSKYFNVNALKKINEQKGLKNKKQNRMRNIRRLVLYVHSGDRSNSASHLGHFALEKG